MTALHLYFSQRINKTRAVALLTSKLAAAKNASLCCLNPDFIYERSFCSCPS